MEQITAAETPVVPAACATGALPANRAEWPDEATRAFRSVLRQLDAWCREHNRSRQINAWIAEEATRQAW